MARLFSLLKSGSLGNAGIHVIANAAQGNAIRVAGTYDSGGNYFIVLATRPDDWEVMSRSEKFQCIVRGRKTIKTTEIHSYEL